MYSNNRFFLIIHKSQCKNVGQNYSNKINCIFFIYCTYISLSFYQKRTIKGLGTIQSYAQVKK